MLLYLSFLIYFHIYTSIYTSLCDIKNNFIITTYTYVHLQILRNICFYFITKVNQKLNTNSVTIIFITFTVQPTSVQ